MPGWLLLSARLALCGVFALAGAAKLADRSGTREAIVGFGAPEGVAAPLAILIPLAELAAAVLLLPAQSAAAGALLALVLLAAFSLAIAANLLRGNAPDCHCFGQLHSAPVGPRTLARNCLLAAAAALVLAGGGGPGAVDWIGRLHGAGLTVFVAGTTAVVTLGAAGVALGLLLRSHGRALVRADRLEQALAEAGIDVEAVLSDGPEMPGLPVGAPAPAFSLRDVTGASVSLADLLRSGRPLLLLFASSQCGPCSALLPRVGRWQRQHAGRVTIALASDGPAEHVRAEAQELSLSRVLLDTGGGLYETFGAAGTPSAVLIDADGSIASRGAAGAERIEALLHAALDRPGLAIGAPAPALELPSLDGSVVALDAVSETGRLLVFWNPDCGYCRAMHGDLLAAAAAPDEGSPQLVIVSSGDAERTRADAFRSSVWLDPEFTAGTAFGAGGTPAAVRLAADGTVASRVAVGADAVLALVRADRTPKLEVVMG